MSHLLATALLTVALLLAWPGAGHATDWAQMEKDYQTTRVALEKAGPRTAPYQWTAAGATWVADPRPALGIGVHTLTQEQADLMRSAGLRLVRKTLYWNQIENTTIPGVHDPKALAAMDAEIALLLRNGFQPLIVVHANPPGTSYANRLAAYDRFATFMAFAAARWPEVRYWELFNEMDGAFTDLFGANAKPDVPLRQRGVMYAEMLKRVTPAIKKANPDALVVIGGMTDWDEFPRGIYAGGGREWFDIMNVHSYGIPLPWGFVLRGAALRAVMNANGDRDKPLWNTEFGLDAGSLTAAWGAPTEGKPGDFFDRMQKAMLADCIEFNLRTGLYQAMFPYQLAAGNEGGRDVVGKLDFGPGRTQDDFGFGLLRADGRTPRPSFQWLQERQANAPLTQEAWAVATLRTAAGQTVTRGLCLDPYPARVALAPGQTLVRVVPQPIAPQETVLRRDGKPFFPLGFVFGADAASLKAARDLGMNSVHIDYSPAELFPASPDAVNPAELAKLRERHRVIAANGLTFFPLLTGHYLPNWLYQAAGGPPKDGNGKPVGLWFPLSLHDPVYLDLLHRYWQLIATEFGSDPNAYAFVSWNEPGYGLDATPAALRAFRAAMRRDYGTLDAFNQAMGTRFTAWDAIQPPRTPDENRAYWYPWVRFHQQSFADFFGAERRFFKTFAPEARLSGKHPVTVLTGDALYCNDVPLQAATQDLYGCDLYNGSITHFRDSMEAARSLSGGGPVISYETHPQAGLKPLHPGLASLQLMAQIIGGCRGIFYFDWDASNPEFGFNNDTATPPPVRAELTRLFQLVNSHQGAFASARPPAEIAVLVSNPATIHYGTGPDPAARDEYTRRLAQTYDLLRNQHFAVDFIADSQLDSRLAGYRLLVLPSLSILDPAGLAAVERFQKHGGKLLAFGDALARDERFAPIPPPAVLGLKSRAPAPWNRGMMRLVEAPSELAPWFRGELTVQKPEIVNPAPSDTRPLLPGETVKVQVGAGPLVANQDAYPSVLVTADGAVVYCAFDSLYSDGLSRLVAGLLATQFNLHPELSVTRGGDETPEALTARTVGEDGTVYYWFANAGPNAAAWQCRLPDGYTGRLTDLVSKGQTIVAQGAFTLKLPAYGYAILRRE
ncbi:MAG: cellulase family glycosylhydrolase [Lentisphaeria bacterium]